MQSILLIGFPNSGKSTIYNLLSGKFRKVSNYSGVTVDSAAAELLSNSKSDQKVRVIDLPGIYNLIPTSIDEAITTSTILRLDPSKSEYHLVALVLDLHRFEASLSLALALKEVVGERLVLIINKDDKKQIGLAQREMLRTLSGLSVISTSAKHDSPRDLDIFLREHLYAEPIEPRGDFTLGSGAIDLSALKIPSERLVQLGQEEIRQRVRSLHEQARVMIAKVLSVDPKQSELTHRLDRLLVHPLWGSIVFFAIFYLIFHSIYTWSAPFMDFIDSQIGSLGEYLGGVLPAGALNSLLVDGIIAGVGGVVIFLPQIVILFFLLSILEQSGYIARAAVVTDRIMGHFGLNGKAFLPYISGFACSIPGIMATRTIPDSKERMATLMTIPMITCSARLPVYVLLIGTFVPETTVLGIFNAQALSFFFLYFLGSFFALIMAKVFRLTYFKGESSNFIIDLPLYQLPLLKLAFKNAYQKGVVFLKKAGTVIMGLSILIWFASSYPKPSESTLASLTPEQQASYTLEHSVLGTMGRAIEPAIKPIGMDWKIGVGLLVAMGARELFVSTLGTIYALGDVDEESAGLRERLKSEVNPVTGAPAFSLAVAWSVLIFFVFALQCTSTLAILKKETGGWRTPLFMFTYMGALAYLGSFIAYQVLS